MKRLFFFTLLALFALGSAYAQEARSPLTVWVSAAAGGSENGVQGSLEGNLASPRLGGVLTVQYTEGSEVLSDAPLKKHQMVNVLYGWMLNAGPLMSRLSAGVGHINGIEHVGWSREELVDGFFGKHGNFPEQRFSHINVPIRADVLLKPFGVVGAGLFIQANVNPTRSFVTTGLQFAIGNLR